MPRSFGLQPSGRERSPTLIHEEDAKSSCSLHNGDNLQSLDVVSETFIEALLL